MPDAPRARPEDAERAARNIKEALPGSNPHSAIFKRLRAVLADSFAAVRREARSDTMEEAKAVVNLNLQGVLDREVIQAIQDHLDRMLEPIDALLGGKEGEKDGE